MFDTQIDFTDAQKQQILENPEIKEELLYWLSSTASDGWWSKKNYEFARNLHEMEQNYEFEEVTLEIVAIDRDF